LSGALLAALAVAVGFASYFSALAMALNEVGAAEVEDRLGPQRSGRSRWLVEGLGDLSQTVGFLRTAGRVTVMLLFVVEFCGFGEAAVVDAPRLAGAGVAAVLVLWLFTSVVSGSIARHAAVALVVRSRGLLRVLDLVGWPLQRVWRLVDEAVRRLSGANLRHADAEEDLLRSIEESQRQGGLDESSAEILENVIAFSETDVAAVMTPRTEIDGIECTNDLGAIRDFIVEAGHSRIPVYEENLDRIIGILYTKDLVPWLGGDASGFALRPLLREPLRVPETKPVRDLLREFQQSEVHLAIVIDEYGGTSGLVTIEDLLEEIVGEIHDEHEPQDEEPPQLSETAAGEWLVSGRFSIDDLADQLGFELDEDREFDTVAGFLLERFGRVPAAGESVEAGGFRFSVAAAEPTHIREVRIERLAAAAAAAEEN
jgi:CBS domain containing-hemolysin-like protein